MNNIFCVKANGGHRSRWSSRLSTFLPRTSRKLASMDAGDVFWAIVGNEILSYICNRGEEIDGGNKQLLSLAKYLERRSFANIHGRGI